MKNVHKTEMRESTVISLRRLAGVASRGGRTLVVVAVLLVVLGVVVVVVGRTTAC